MKISFSVVMSFLFISFCTVGFISVINFMVLISRVNDYHYATVHEIESSDFSPYVIADREADGKYQTEIVSKGVKEDLRIYEVKTSLTINMPIFGYSQLYEKTSVAR